MFLQRLITSLVLVPLVLLAIFYGNPWLLATLIGLIFVALVQESLQLIPLKKISMCIGYFGFLLLSIWGSGYFFAYWMQLGLLVWVFNIIVILGFPRSQRLWGYPAVVMALFMILLPLFIQSLIHLYYFVPKGKELIIYLLFLIWASDVGAYFSGKLLGRHKLIPQVSPGKSWEGVIGGVALAMIVAGLGHTYLHLTSGPFWFVLALCTVLISIFGDLFISILKRRCHLKDTGSIIPGHGGVLDRLDSLIAALPFFYFGLTCG